MGATENVQSGELGSQARDFTAPVAAREVLLIVEDEYLVALDIKQRVERLGYVADVAYSGESALARAGERRFDLVLMDIKLKGALDGIETARALKASCDTPLVYLTAYADDVTLARARATEPYGYVLKPFQERELKAAIELAIQRHRSDRMRTEEHRAQHFLLDASARLGASLDYRSVAHGAADLIVPHYADWCAIHVQGGSERIPALVYTRPGGDHTASCGVLVGSMAETVEHTRRPDLVTELGDQVLAELVGSAHVETLAQIGAQSLLCVPLLARNEVLGSLTLAAGSSRSRYTVSDLVIANDFAHRLALALDNAFLYQQAERAIRMRDDVLAIVSHDLRSPLGAILFQAETLAKNPTTGATAVSIMRSVQRMNRLIGDLLDASAINAGSLTLELKNHPAAEIAREAIDMFRSQAEARAIDLRVELPVEPVGVRCDRDRIVQVLSNLLGNAVKFTPRGGVVTLRVVRAGQEVRFEVEDNGQGVSAEQLPHLFDRFWRGQTRNNGAGLGLFIARGIIVAHGSTIDVETAVGEGSRFFFWLPIEGS